MPNTFVLISWLLCFSIREVLLLRGNEYAAGRVSAASLAFSVATFRTALEKIMPGTDENICWLLAAVLAMATDTCYYRWRKNQL